MPTTNECIVPCSLSKGSCSLNSQSEVDFATLFLCCCCFFTVVSINYWGFCFSIFALLYLVFVVAFVVILFEALYCTNTDRTNILIRMYYKHLPQYVCVCVCVFFTLTVYFCYINTLKKNMNSCCPNVSSRSSLW